MLPKEVEAELSRIEQEFARFEAGAADPDEFKRFRLENGIYGIREATDEFMVRVKIRFGALNPEQLERLSEIAERFTPLKLGHITTRQDVQFHHIQGKDIPLILRLLAEVGLTTREACGNTVRNVTCCPYAGISPEEAFDVTPYADAVSRYFLRNPVNQNLPRKFKVAFEGCRTDHAYVSIHDLAAVAVLDQGKRGFRLYVGGGLGATPMVAQLLEAFTPAEHLIPSIEAVLRLFDRHGDRAHKDRARIKFLLKDWGIEEFRKRWEAELRIVRATASGVAQSQWVSVSKEEEAPPKPVLPPCPRPPDGFVAWLKSDVFPQKQGGYATVTIRCPLGDATAGQTRAVARLADTFCQGRIRTTISQNLLLRWVPTEQLPSLYTELSQAGLDSAGAGTLMDITRCPGADTCNLAITHSRGLAAALEELLSKEPSITSDPALSSLSLKISGCPNSCGQHHIADVGFYGTARVVEGKAVPHYQLLLGGGTIGGETTFGKAIARIPARRVPEAVKHLLHLYQQSRQDTEPCRAWVGRIGLEKLQAELAPFTTVASFSEQPQLYEDLGEKGEFKVQTGKGECAA